MRLIDADEVKKYILTEGFYCDTDADKMYSAALVDKVFPTIEAEPVRHGHWIYTPADTDTTTKARFKCSECGRMRNMFVRYQHKYCAECGAKMDEGCDENR